MNEIKKFQARSFGIAATGIGLGALAGVSEDENTSHAIGHLGKGLGHMANLTAMDATMSMLGKYTKRKG